MRCPSGRGAVKMGFVHFLVLRTRNYGDDCREVLATLPADSVDAVVTDPPYGLEFMGRAWDRSGGVAFDLDTSCGITEGLPVSPISQPQVHPPI